MSFAFCQFLFFHKFFKAISKESKTNLTTACFFLPLLTLIHLEKKVRRFKWPRKSKLGDNLSGFSLNDKRSKSGKSLEIACLNSVLITKGQNPSFLQLDAMDLLRVLAHNLECSKDGLALLILKNSMTL